MRYAILFRPQFPIPPDAFPSIIEGVSDWWNRYKRHFEAAGFFAGGHGGAAICDINDAAELNRMLLEWPLGQFHHIEVQPLIDMDTTLRQWDEVRGMDARAHHPS